MATSFPGFYTPGFFLVGFLKVRVFVPPLPANVVELRTRIIAAVAEMTPERLRSVWQETDYSQTEPQLSQVKLDEFKTLHVL
jgi:hypothetical protein